MGEVDWVSGSVVLLVGIALGVVLLKLTGRGGRAAPASPPSRDDLRRADLLARKAELYEQIRDLTDMEDRRGEQASEERRELERRAADVLRELAALDGRAVGAPAPRAGREAEGVRAPEPAPAPAPGGELRGALIGGTLVALFGLVLWGLQGNFGLRPEGGIATGGDFVPMGSAGTNRGAGAPVEGVPPALQPKPSAAVDAARAAVAAAPNDVNARVGLGWALIDAEGWIDAYQTAEQTLAIAPNNADARVQLAAVRTVMGMDSVARTLVEEAVELDPQNVQAWSYRGMLAMRAGDPEAAVVSWEEAKAHGGDPAAFDRLIQAVTSGGPLPPALQPREEAGHPGPNTTRPAEASPPPSGSGAQAAAGTPIRGTITLAEGARAPEGGVLFVIARPAGVERGPPAATRRYDRVSFPLEFSLGAEHVMMGGAFPAEVSLSARLDADGNAMSRSDEDLAGAAGTVRAGAEGVRIELR